MRMPHVDDAIVSSAKIVGYLLSRTHPSGRTKAGWFTAFGFASSEWERLSTSLREHAARNDVVESEETPFGQRYTIEGPISTPEGRNPSLRKVWFVETGETVPRFVTAYPLRRRPNDQRT